MTNDCYTKQQVKTGRKLMAQVKGGPRRPANPTPAYPPFGYMCAANLDALIVCERAGGWVADVLFKNVPAGYPEVIGTKDAKPMNSYKNALAVGIEIVEGVRRLPPPLFTGPDPYIGVAYKL